VQTAIVTLRPMLLKYNIIRQDRRQIGMPKLIHFLVLIAKTRKGYNKTYQFGNFVF